MGVDGREGEVGVENKEKSELVATITGSLPIWSFFLGSALSAVVGALLLVLPDIFQKFEVTLDPVKQWTLTLAGIVWIFGCGGYLLFLAPIKEIYRIRAVLKDYVRRSDCNGCADIQSDLMQECLRLKTENARLRVQIGKPSPVNAVDCEVRCNDSKQG